MHGATSSPQPVVHNPLTGSQRALTTVLLVCGVLSALLYVAMLIVVPTLWLGYDSAFNTVSELFAIGTPTRALWVSLAVNWIWLYVAFGWGVWRAAGNNRRLRVVGAMISLAGIFAAFWPPMHQREVLATGGGALTDTLHDTWTVVNAVLTVFTIGIGASSMDRQFRRYSVVTIGILLITGVLTALEGPNVDANLPTPWIGVWERVHIVAWLLWVAVLAIKLTRRAWPDRGNALV